MRALLVALATFCLISWSVPGVAAQGWERLGRSAISSAGVGRVVVVAPGMFRRVMLEASGAAEVSNISVEFVDGTSFAPPDPLSFSATERSRVIELPGAAKAIRSLGFRIRNLGDAQQGQSIVLYGGPV